MTPAEYINQAKHILLFRWNLISSSTGGCSVFDSTILVFENKKDSTQLVLHVMKMHDYKNHPYVLHVTYNGANYHNYLNEDNMSKLLCDYL